MTGGGLNVRFNLDDKHPTIKTTTISTQTGYKIHVNVRVFTEPILPSFTVMTLKSHF